MHTCMAYRSVHAVRPARSAAPAAVGLGGSAVCVHGGVHGCGRQAVLYSTASCTGTLAAVRVAGDDAVATRHGTPHRITAHTTALPPHGNAAEAPRCPPSPHARLWGMAVCMRGACITHVTHSSHIAHVTPHTLMIHECTERLTCVAPPCVHTLPPAAAACGPWRRARACARWRGTLAL
jgi:hypothetical protein